MSTNQTANLGLCQWEATDPVIRTDFNSDNQKIDAAMGALPYVKLMEVTVTETADVLEVDLSDLDLTKYMYLEFAGNLWSSDSSYYYAQMRINSLVGYSSASIYSNYAETRLSWFPLGATSTTAQAGALWMRVVLGDNRPAIYVNTVGSVYPTMFAAFNCGGPDTALSPSALNTLQFTCGGTSTTDSTVKGFAVGSHFTIYGLKK
jgi:hypothetical protein